MMTLEENKLTGFLWDQLKPFIRGKILFTPDTAATRRIVGVVNDTFRPIGDIHRLARAWINTYADRVRGLFLDEENQQFIKVCTSHYRDEKYIHKTRLSFLVSFFVLYLSQDFM